MTKIALFKMIKQNRVFNQELFDKYSTFVNYSDTVQGLPNLLLIDPLHRPESVEKAFLQLEKEKISFDVIPQNCLLHEALEEFQETNPSDKKQKGMHSVVH